MAHLTCNNPECSLFGDNLDFMNFTLIFDDGHFQPKYEELCKNCKQPLIFVNNEVIPNEITTTFGRFKSGTAEEKKAMIKKRNVVNKDKELIERAKQKKVDMINNIKEQFTKNIKK